MKRFMFVSLVIKKLTFTSINKQCFVGVSEVSLGTLLNDKTQTETDSLSGQARSQGGSGGSADAPLRTKGPLFFHLAREIIKANNYKWLTIYLHQLLCTKPPTKWLQNLLGKGGSGGANL